MAREIDWPAVIGRHVLVQQKIRDLDHEKIWGHELPAVRASAERIQQVEAALGALPTQFREFLGFVDGWRSFYQWVDLFGSNEQTGSARFEAQHLADALRSSGRVPELANQWKRLLPIGVTRVSERHAHLGADLFLLVRSGLSAGFVYWLGGEELVDEFPDFFQFFVAMTAYGEREVARLSAERR